MIFWFLVAFSVVLLVATWLRAAGDAPAQEARLPLAPRPLLRDYVAILLNPRFQRLAAASAFNFAALWLYIASAPAFVVDLLKLDEREFGWFFVPMIGGMVLGAFVSGRTAGQGQRRAAGGDRFRLLGAWRCCSTSPTTCGPSAAGAVGGAADDRSTRSASRWCSRS